jgi:hypothetical protein
LPFDWLAAGGAQPRQSEIERHAQYRARGVRRTFAPRWGGDARHIPDDVPHDITLPPDNGVVTFHFRALRFRLCIGKRRPAVRE